jgi:glycosyltransferase involved in cell wall biosynthesis
VNRLKVLLSAYACEPGKGSEPGVGWHTAQEMSKRHDVWVLTRESNRALIEAELVRQPLEHLQFIYYDLPRWARWWKRGGRGVQLYYYLWQLAAYFVARKHHRTVGFDLVHHVTFVKYWAPSFVSLLPVPFIWGPVGGGESAPPAFWKSYDRSGQLYERLRDVARWFGEHDPFVRLTARRSTQALVTTRETFARVRKLGARSVELQSEAALELQELEHFRTLSKTFPPKKETGTFRFISMGRLLCWKGYHLSIEAFAAANLPDAEYLLLGDGPERSRLEALIKKLGLEKKVTLLGRLPRAETLGWLANSDVLIHPSLHDSGGWVCLEAMAAGKPVICLDLGGPSVQITEAAGYRISAQTPKQTIGDMAKVMHTLVSDEKLREKMGAAGQQRIASDYSWHVQGIRLDALYQRTV